MKTEKAPARETLFLIDGSAFAYRSHHAFSRNPLVTKNGEVVSAIFGFANSLLRILEREKPDYLVVVFDAKGPTFRHERFPDYKATRQKMPDELVAQLPAIHEMLQALQIPDVVVPSVEADDVIGTLALRAAARDLDVRIASGDKDFMQLVDERIRLYPPARGEGDPELVGAEQVVAKFGVRPDQIIDLLALMGDSSDNVPGVPKIGQKTAAQLLETFDSLDHLYESLEEVQRPAVRRNLEAGRESAEISKDLVTIRTDLDLEVGLDDLRSRPMDLPATRGFFDRYEFRTLLARLPDPEPEAGAPAEAEDRDYRLIQSQAQLDEMIAELRDHGFFALDTETTGLDPMRAELVGISVSSRPASAWYLPLKKEQGLFANKDRPGNEVLGDSLDTFRRLLADADVKKAGQNVKYDLHVLERAGFPVCGVAFDSMVAHYCIEPSASAHGLDALSLRYFGHTKIKTRDVIGRGRKQLTMAEVPTEEVSEYACEDADYTFRLAEVLGPELDAQGVRELFETVEMPLIDVLRRMEAAGVSIDSDALREMGVKFRERAGELETQIFSLAGETFNINSTRQLGEILYEKLAIHTELGVKRIPRTKTGYSTNAQALAQLSAHPLVARVLEYRQIEKLRSTYVDALPELVNPETGRIHTSFNQAVAATGRLSSSDPNLQNIPIRTAEGREIRRAFQSSFEGGTLISADYSQVELRILAHLARDEQLLEAFRRGEDVHRRTAALVFHEQPEQVTPELRTRAKAINFGIVYGMGAPRLARETGLTVKEASQFIKRYFEVFSGVKEYLDSGLENARQNGYVTTLLGRRRAIPELYSNDPRIAANARNVAINTPIQGTAADLIKVAMIRVDRELAATDLQSRMVLQVHDELVFDVAPGEGEQVAKLAVRGMENAIELVVPLKVDVGEGRSWLDAH